MQSEVMATTPKMPSEDWGSIDYFKEWKDLRQKTIYPSRNFTTIRDMSDQQGTVRIHKPDTGNIWKPDFLASSFLIIVHFWYSLRAMSRRLDHCVLPLNIGPFNDQTCFFLFFSIICLPLELLLVLFNKYLISYGTIALISSKL